MQNIRHLFLLTAAFAILLMAGHARAQQAPKPLEAGVDYQLISAGQTFSDNKEKIEVAEVFSYRCHHCSMFQPMSDAWRKRLPADVNYVHVPATFDIRDPFARAYFVAEKAGLTATSHAALFRAIHTDRNFPGNPSVEELTAFHIRHGADRTRFLAAMNSPETTALLQKSRAFIEANGVMGTPTLIIDGKYRVTGRSHHDNIRIANQLIEQLRAERRRSPSKQETP